ncbi:MAG: chorismate mutase [Acidimicrobiales bacterium]
MLSVRAVRGATTIDRDEVDHIADRVEAMVRAILDRNGLQADQLISLLFSATGDIHATFPATVARARIPELAEVPLMNMAELDIVGALPRCVRVMVHCCTEQARGAIEHVYLEGAVALRPDLATS